MDEHEFMVERFEQQRPRLRAVAYRMLGSASEADDALQEAWLKVSKGRHEWGGERRWLVDDRHCACMPQHPSVAARRGDEEPLEASVPDPIVHRRCRRSG